jgi:hypothetical protein
MFRSEFHVGWKGAFVASFVPLGSTLADDAIGLTREPAERARPFFKRSRLLYGALILSSLSQMCRVFIIQTGDLKRALGIVVDLLHHRPALLVA